MTCELWANFHHSFRFVIFDSFLCRNFHLAKGGTFEKEATIERSTTFIEVYLIDYQQGRNGFTVISHAKEIYFTLNYFQNDRMRLVRESDSS